MRLKSFNKSFVMNLFKFCLRIIRFKKRIIIGALICYKLIDQINLNQHKHAETC